MSSKVFGTRTVRRAGLTMQRLLLVVLGMLLVAMLAACGAGRPPELAGGMSTASAGSFPDLKEGRAKHKIRVVGRHVFAHSSQLSGAIWL